MKKVLLTIALSLTFSLIGLWSFKVLNSVWAFPILFGISIPLANWDKLGPKRIQKVIIIGITALGLFFIGRLAIWDLELDSKWITGMISGIIGLLFLLVNSAFIETLKLKVWTYLLTFVLCSLAFPVGIWTIYLFGDLSDLINSDTVFLIWTFSFTICLVTGLVNKNKAGNTVLKSWATWVTDALRKPKPS